MIMRASRPIVIGANPSGAGFSQAVKGAGWPEMHVKPCQTRAGGFYLKGKFG